jgi:hypothetical protein
VPGEESVGCLRCDLENASEVLGSGADVRSWLARDLPGCYLSLKRTEISVLDGADPEVTCGWYPRVY